MKKESVEEGLADEEAEDLEETRKELIDLMAADSKPHFNNI